MWKVDKLISTLYNLLYTFLCSILDDAELFELKKSFTIDELCSMGSFFNHLIYESVIMVPDRKCQLSFINVTVWSSAIIYSINKVNFIWFH